MSRNVIDAAVRGCAEHSGWSEDNVRYVLCVIVEWAWTMRVK